MIIMKKLEKEAWWYIFKLNREKEKKPAKKEDEEYNEHLEQEEKVMVKQKMDLNDKGWVYKEGFC